MKKEITLEHYLRLGGKLEKVDWNNAYCDYSDKNYKIKILSCEDRGDRNNHGGLLFHFNFENGNTHRYAISWIKLNVEFELSEKYK